MRAFHFTVAALLLAAACTELPAQDGAPPADCAAAIDPLRQGFGTPGPFAAERHTLTNPAWPTQTVTVYLPRGLDEPAPVVLLAHDEDKEHPEIYASLVAHVVSRGFALVFPTHQVEDRRHRHRYDALTSGLSLALGAHAERLDPERLGLVGHSFGAGALPALAHYALVERGYGERGAFLFSLAPGYGLELAERSREALPEHLAALFLVFEGDELNDPGIAIDQWRRLYGSLEADYLMLRSDERGGCTLPATNAVPQTGGPGGRRDAYDQRAIFRLFDALAAWAFVGDELGRRTALGRGAPEQVSMGHWRDGTPLRPLVWVEDPQPPRPESEYRFPRSGRAAWEAYGE